VIESVRPYLLRVLAVAIVTGLAVSQAWAQERRVEVSGTVGWTFSDGVTGVPADVAGLGVFDAVDPKDAFSWGARVGFLVARSVEVGFLYDQQATQLEFSGPGVTVDAGDMTIRTYHGYLAYNFGSDAATISPYVLVGLGATSYGAFRPDRTVVPAATLPVVDGTTKFSMTTAAGLKIGGPRVRYLIEGRFTPTYIRSAFDGWYCDSDWGCYVVDEPQYASQFEIAGGIAFRF